MFVSDGVALRGRSAQNPMVGSIRTATATRGFSCEVRCTSTACRKCARVLPGIANRTASSALENKRLQQAHRAAHAAWRYESGRQWHLGVTDPENRHVPHTYPTRAACQAGNGRDETSRDGENLRTRTSGSFRTSSDGLGRGIGGARRDRTADLLHAMQALSQLSYGPTGPATLREASAGVNLGLRTLERRAL